MDMPVRRYALHWRETGLLARRRLLETLLNAPIHVHGPGRKAAPDVAWIGWGLKDSGLRARKLAKRDGSRMLLLEDGFLRSFGLGVTGAPLLSIIADTAGVHYDATRPSDLENMLRAGGFPADELETARRAMALIRREGISKYNAGLPPPPERFAAEEERVLVVDQTAGDLSLKHGFADERTFREMLEAALDENPRATVWIRTHPDVLTGRRKGMLPRISSGERVRMMPTHWHPADILRHFDKVYVATSLLGMEALMAGIPVRCFGMPFYAGWGLTEDIRTCSRRGVSRTLEELFAAAYLHSARYLDPRTGGPGDIFTVLQYLADLRRERTFWARTKGAEWSGRVFVFGFRFWKHAQTAPFFGEEVDVRFVRSAGQARRAGLSAHDRLAVWGMRDPPGLKKMERKFGLKAIRVEDGFLRSVGLGTDFVPPWSLVFDDLGIYFDPRHESRLERLLAETDFSPDLLETAARLRKRIVDLELTKYNLAEREVAADVREAAGSRKIILVPGQVETDASIRFGCASVRTNAELLRRVRTDFPDAFVIYKPHPDVLAGNRARGSDGPAARLADHVETEAGLPACIRACDEVHTMTSLSGFDALLRGKRVVTRGAPFYAGWGLTVDMEPLARRKRRLTLDMLVAGTLLLYPRYRDPCKSVILDAEEVVERLACLRNRAYVPGGPFHKWLLMLRGVVEGIMWHAERMTGSAMRNPWQP